MELIYECTTVADIKKLIDELYAGRPFDSLSREQQVALWYVNSIMSPIDTLEAKEVDFDFMLHEYWGLSAKINIDCLECATMTKEEMTTFAKHFFELGLKTQKGKNKMV